MVTRAFLFILITFGVTMAVSLFVATLIKLIAMAVHREKKSATS